MIQTLRCDRKLLEQNLKGKTYIVTSANSGVGFETTSQLVSQGAHVIMGCRRVEAGKAVAQQLTPLDGSVDILPLDLGNKKSILQFNSSVKKKYKRIDGMVNNAGMVANGNEPTRTKEGYEVMFAINHLGHFLLTESLLDLIQASAPSRIVILSSVGHAGNKKKRPTIHFDDLHYHQRPYNRTDAYCESKLANLLYANELADRLAGTGVTVTSVHPGWARSNLAGKGLTGFVQNVVLRPVAPLLTIMSNEDAAQTSLHCLLEPSVVNHSGAYFSQNSLLYADRECRRGGWPMESPNPHAKDIKLARKLTEVSYQLIGWEGK